MDCTGNLIGSITAMQSLLSNFPDNILNANGWDRKEYDSILDFIVDLLKPFGLSQYDILNFILSKITGFSEKTIEAIEKGKDIGDVADEYYESGWLMELENVVKYVISTALASIPTCSANLMIGDSFFDGHKVIGNDIGRLYSEGGIVVPIKDIDPFNYLKFCPLSMRGNGYYSGCDHIEKVSDLYKAPDMNAFLWYCKNRSSISNQYDVNKTMWDNRIVFENRDCMRGDKEWNNWISSKKNRYYDEADRDSILKLEATESGKEILKNIRPILQVKYVDNIEPSLMFQIPSQEFYRTRKIFSVGKGTFGGNAAKMALNKTLIEYNIAYSQSIRIFSAKTIITSLFETFLSDENSEDINLSIRSFMPKSMIRNVIRKSIGTETAEINDCFFSFSNDEFNSMLEEMEQIRFSGKPLNDATNRYIKMDPEKTEKSLEKVIGNNEENTGTVNEEKTTITKELYELSSVVTPGEDGGIEVKVASNWLEELLNNLVISLVSPILSPKVITLFVLNYRILGYEPLGSAEEILRKLLSVIISCIQAIVEMIVKLLLELLLNMLSKGIVSYIMLRSLEMITNYMLLLQRTISLCLPKFGMFDFERSIDYVEHADIVPEKTIPDSKTGC